MPAEASHTDVRHFRCRPGVYQELRKRRKAAKAVVGPVGQAEYETPGMRRWCPNRSSRHLLKTETRLLTSFFVVMERDRRLTGSLRGQTNNATAPRGFEVSQPWKVRHKSQNVRLFFWKNTNSTSIRSNQESFRRASRAMEDRETRKRGARRAHGFESAQGSSHHHAAKRSRSARSFSSNYSQFHQQSRRTVTTWTLYLYLWPILVQPFQEHTCLAHGLT